MEGLIQADEVLRLTRFVSTAPHHIDSALRDAVAAFLAQAALIGAWFGRRTAEVGEERAFASVWRSAEDEIGGLRMAEMVGAEADGGAPLGVVLPVAFRVSVERSVAAAILRIYDGVTFAGQLDAYIEEAMAGSRLDAERPDGPLVVCTALERPVRFVTISVWSDWASLEACTGGDIRRPLLSRNAARLAGGGPTHYEIIPGPT